MRSFGHVEEAAKFFKKATGLIPQSSVIREDLAMTYVRILLKDEATFAELPVRAV